MQIISSFPYTITSPGQWRVDGTVDGAQFGASPTPLITIACDNVFLDGAGAWLIDSYGPGKEGKGVYALNRSNCTVRGFKLFGAGFAYPIHFENTDDFASGANVIEDNDVSGNFRGIRAEGRDEVIRNNRIHDIGGATWGTDLYAFGVEFYGPRCEVYGNDIREVYGNGATGESVGISATGTDCNESVVKSNYIRNKSRVDRSIAMWLGYSNDPANGTPKIYVMDNSIIKYKRALWGTQTDGLADDNYALDCGWQQGDYDSPHPLYDVPVATWTGNNVGT